MSIKKDFIQTVKIVVLALMLSLGVSYVFAAWQGPTQPAPDGNVPAPINVGTVPQVKNGDLSVLKFNANDTASIFAKLRVIDGTQGAGKVFVSDAAGQGSWTPRTSSNAQEICMGLGGTWTSNTCNFPGGPSANPQQICIALGGAWDSATSKCTLFGGGGGGASGSFGVSLCKNDGTAVSGRGDNTACSEVIKNYDNSLATFNDRYYAVQCSQTKNGIKMSAEAMGLWYRSGAWVFSPNAGDRCDDGTIVVIDSLATVVGGGGSGGGITQITSSAAVINTGTNSSVIITSPTGPTTNLAVNTNVIQSRVTGTCPGQAISVINPNGTVTCQPIPTAPASAICTYGGVTYSTGVSCTTTKYSDSFGAHYKTQTCRADGTWSSESGVKDGLDSPAMCGVGSGSTGSSGLVSIGGGGWEGSSNPNNPSCINRCNVWGGASCSTASCNQIISCPSGYNKIVTGSYEQVSDLPLHHKPFGSFVTIRAAAFTCYK